MSSLRRCCRAIFVFTACVSGFRKIRTQPADQDLDLDEPAMKVTFMRHGVSAGNAGVRGAWEKGDIFAYQDGELMKKGVQQAESRIESLDQETFQRVSTASVVLTSPLRRALATTLVVVAKTLRRHIESQLPEDPYEDLDLLGCVDMQKYASNYSWPEMRVITELREKIASKSDIPGEIDAAIDYMRVTARQIGVDYFCNETALYFPVQQLISSYKKERHASKRWTINPRDGGPPPDNALNLINMIRTFKKKVLNQLTAKSVFIVGHNGWSRYAFNTFLTFPDSGVHPSNLLKATALSAGGRNVYPLNNCGIFGILYKDGMFFRDDSINYELLSAFNGSPNFATKERKQGMYVSLPEAQEAGSVPHDGVLQRYMFEMKDLLYKKRLFTLASAPSLNTSTLTWGKKWGIPVSTIDITNLLMHRVHGGSDSSLEFILHDRRQQITLDLKALNPEDLESFSLLLASYKRRAQKFGSESQAAVEVKLQRDKESDQLKAYYGSHSDYGKWELIDDFPMP